MIHVVYKSIDGHREALHTEDLAKAQEFAHKWVGKYPEIGSTYAVAGDGVGKVEVLGVSLQQLFPGA